MNIIDLKNKKSIFWILHISGWIALGLIYLVLYYRNYLSDPKSMLTLFLTYLTGFSSSLILRHFYKKINYQNYSIGHLSIIVLAGSFIVGHLWFGFDILLTLPINGVEWFHEKITFQRYLSNTYWHTFILGTWSTLYYLIKLWVEWSLQKERILNANALAQAAQLQMLRYQLNPHFLFNALNSIRALVDENQKHAKEMITELSEFLRYSLISKNYSDVPLKQELEAIRHYLRIEKKRYEEKLQIDYKINPLAEEYPVLSFLIHPLVENAVKYGMQTSSMPVQIVLKADVQGDTLNVEVCNSGSWIEPDSKNEQKQGTGTGLKNIQQRLQNAYPDNHHFEVAKESKQVCVRIEIKKTSYLTQY